MDIFNLDKQKDIKYKKKRKDQRKDMQPEIYDWF